jgi:hypothetical protein
MKTDDLMQLALDMVGWESVPADSAIYVPGKDLRRVLLGLDIGTAELLMARQLGYDAVIAHHPVGLPHRVWPVYERHVALMTAAGVPEEAARAAIQPKLQTLQVEGQACNYEQVPQAARHLGMPFLNIHCPLDELGRRVMQETVDNLLAAQPGASLAAVAAALADLPAARRAETDVAIRLGEPEAPAGKVLVSHAAYTNGGYAVASTCFRHGVDTVIYIHISSADLERLQADGRGQLIVTGHIVGDAFGIAPYVGALRGRGLQVDVLSRVLDPAA